MKLLENPHQEIEQAAYSSWLGFLPFAVFLGSKSKKDLLVSIATGWILDGLTLVNVGQDTTLSDGNVAQKLVQLLIVSDGELKMTGDDTCLLVVTSSVASQLEDFGGQVLKDGSKVHWGTSTNTLSVVALSQETVNTTDWECETRLGGSASMKLVLMFPCTKCVAQVRRLQVQMTKGTPCFRWQSLTIERSWSQRLFRQIFRQSF